MFLTKLNDKIMRPLNWVIISSMAILSFLVFLQIVNRFIFKVPMPWTDEFAKYFFVWLSLYGSAKAVREKSHIFVDIIELFIKGQFGIIVGIIAEIVCLSFYVILLVVSVPWTLENIDVWADSMQIGMGVFYSCIPIGAFLMILFATENLLLRLPKYQQADQNVEKEGGAI